MLQRAGGSSLSRTPAASSPHLQPPLLLQSASTTHSTTPRGQQPHALSPCSRIVRFLLENVAVALTLCSVTARSQRSPGRRFLTNDMALDDTDSSLSSLPSSVFSSPLSSPANSPSPPPDEFLPILARQRALQNPYPSPPASQLTSQSASPAPDGMESSTVTDKDESRPTKRRRISKERSKELLDLQSDDVEPDQQHQLDRLLEVLHKHQKIVVVAGAGISVSAGSTSILLPVIPAC